MHRHRGDTIIEVMMSVTIFSLVAVGAIAIMNSGVAMAQRSVEITLARQQIDAQAEMLRYVHDKAVEGSSSAYRTLWNDIRNRTGAASVTAPVKLMNIKRCPNAIPNSVALVARGDNSIGLASSYQSAPPTFARMNGEQAQGISIQMTRVSGGAAYDAYIQACWSTPGSPQPVTIGTIVRLYDQRV